MIKDSKTGMVAMCTTEGCTKDAVVQDDMYEFSCEDHAVPETEMCQQCHTEQNVTSGGSSWGFAGPIYYTTLACGHNNLDVSADVPEM